MYNKSIKSLMMKRIKMTKFGILFSIFIARCSSDDGVDKIKNHLGRSEYIEAKTIAEDVLKEENNNAIVQHLLAYINAVSDVGNIGKAVELALKVVNNESDEVPHQLRAKAAKLALDSSVNTEYNMVIHETSRTIYKQHKKLKFLPDDILQAIAIFPCKKCNKVFFDNLLEEDMIN